MKKASLIFQSLLALAVAVLYVLHFTNRSANQEQGSSLPETGPLSESRLAYVNMDSLLENYGYYQQQKTAAEKQQKDFEEEMERKRLTLEKEYRDAQTRAQSGQMTEVQMAEVEEKLMRRQQEMMQFRQEKEEDVLETNSRLTQDIFSRIQDHLRELNKDSRYHFVFGYAKEGGILLAHDSLNITSYVLEGLNRQE